MTMSEPLSVTQMLSCLSTFTVCANDHAYRLWPISRMYLPSGSNSRSCAAAARISRARGVAARENEDVSLELTATPEDFAEIHVGRKLQKIGHGTVGHFGIAGCWAQRELAISSNTNMERLMKVSGRKDCHTITHKERVFRGTSLRRFGGYCFSHSSIPCFPMTTLFFFGSVSLRAFFHESGKTMSELLDSLACRRSMASGGINSVPTPIADAPAKM